MKRLLTWACVISLALIAPATAAVSQGDTELDLLGGWIGLNTSAALGADVSTWFLTGSVGYFVTNELQLGGSILGAWADAGIGGDVKVIGVGGEATYHFMTTNQWVPYIGVMIFWAQVSNAATNDGWMWGPIAGIRYELNQYNDLFVEYQYQDYQGTVSNVLPNANMVLVGVSHQFK